MPLLKEIIYRANCKCDPKAAFARLVAKLKGHKFDIEKEDSGSGEIVVHYESLLMNWIIWRCWSDELLFRVRAAADGDTTIEVYAIPNLFKITAEKTGQRDSRTLISRLMLEDI